MELAVDRVRPVVEALIHDYELTPAMICLAGGGGSAGVLIPYLGEAMGLPWKIVKNAPIISTIGVALAMVREVVERTVVAPTDEDIRAIRREAMTRILQSGAHESSVEIAIEIDKKANILRAVAMGTTELRTGSAGKQVLDLDALRELAARAMGLPLPAVSELASVGKWHIFEGVQVEKHWLIFHTTRHWLRVLDRDGVVRLQKEPLGLLVTTRGELFAELTEFVDSHSEYGTVGAQLPLLYGYYGEKQVDMSGLVSREQIDSVLEMELEGVKDEACVVIVAAK